MTIQKELKQVVDILQGYSFRASIKEAIGADIAVIQSKDITDNIFIEFKNVAKIKKREFNQKFFLRQGDVLLSARGKFKAGLIKNISINSVASSSVYILKVNNNIIHPEYLAIILNSTEWQKKLDGISSGAIIKSILKRELEELKIAVPNLNKQKKIVEIFNNYKRQQKLLNQKIFLTNKITNSLINKMLNI